MIPWVWEFWFGWMVFIDMQFCCFIDQHGLELLELIDRAKRCGIDIRIMHI